MDINNMTNDEIIKVLESRLKNYDLEGVEICKEDAESVRNMVNQGVSFDDAVNATLEIISSTLD